MAYINENNFGFGINDFVFGINDFVFAINEDRLPREALSPLCRPCFLPYFKRDFFNGR